MRPDAESLRADIEALAAFERPSASEGERRAAEWIAARLREQGLEAQVEEERAHGTWHAPIAVLSAIAAVGGVAALSGRRMLGAVGGAAAFAAMVDEFDHGTHVARRPLPHAPVWNVWAAAGDPEAARTIVVYAHHDAAYGGTVFTSGPQRALAELLPSYVERTDTSVPMHWPVLAGPALVALGALAGRRGAVAAGTALAALTLAVMADIHRAGVVPGANDNLSGVAGLLALARGLRRRPVRGVRVLLLSAGAEESFQQGIRAWGERHFGALDPASTWFVNLETIGSPELALLEGEGPLRMRDYDEGFKADVAATAADLGIHLRRGLRSRPSTDGTTPHRAGFRTAVLISVTWFKSLANYHWPSDVPENVDLETVRDAVALTDGLIRRLAAPAESTI